MIHALKGIIGYTISIYVPGKEDMITPIRYIPDWETVTTQPEKIKKMKPSVTENLMISKEQEDNLEWKLKKSKRS